MCLAVAGCERAPEVTPAGGAASFVDHAWTRADDAAPRGSLWIFLADGTLLQDSCFETQRLSRWTSAGDGALRWEEDGVEIRATVETAAEDRLVLRLHLVGGDEERRFERAPVPYVCPDLPR
ncbi:MAG TPA: hypothetical protein VFO94_00530 [Gammaproteobacteria bacterium]|nr:hypothetical protein [Gammaproteobacteria bacterium]